MQHMMTAMQLRCNFMQYCINEWLNNYYFIVVGGYNIFFLRFSIQLNITQQVLYLSVLYAVKLPKCEKIILRIEQF